MFQCFVITASDNHLQRAFLSVSSKYFVFLSVNFCRCWESSILQAFLKKLENFIILLNLSKDAAILPDEDKVEREKKDSVADKNVHMKHTKQNKETALINKSKNYEFLRIVLQAKERYFSIRLGLIKQSHDRSAICLAI